MNKQELIDKAVHSLSGVWPSRNANDDSFCLTAYGLGSLCAQAKFEQRARELGYINGYRWGVEYPTNGKKPDLPDDVLVDVKFAGRRNFHHVGCAVNNWPFDQTSHFKIVDDKYKPADTSYLEDFATRYAHDKAADINQELEEKFYAELERAKDVSEIPESKSNTENVSDWYDYEAQEMKTLPNNNTDVELLMGGVYQCRVEYIGIRSFKVVFYRYDTHEIDHAELPTASFRPLDHNRKAEAEKKRVVDAAFDEAIKAGCVDFRQWLSVIYDAGFLRMPAE